MSAAATDERTLLLPELGLHTRLIDAGTGPVVVMLHGNPDNADEWRPLIERLRGRYRCIAPDFPGYGKAPEPPPSFTYSLAEQMQFLEAILKIAQVSEPFVLVLHDTGGMVGTAWAAANMHRLRGVMFTNTVVFERYPWFAIARGWGKRSLLGRLRAALGMRALGLRRGALFRKIFGAQSPQLSAADLARFTRDFALNTAAKATTLRQFRQFMQPEFFAGFETMRAQLVESVPCRVLWGDKDPYIPVRYARLFGRASVKILPHAGHWVPLVAPDELAAEVAAFA